MTPIDWSCGHQNPDLTNCGADAGEPCNWQTSPHPEFHDARIGIGDGSKPTVTPDQVNAAIDKVAEALGIC